jgi:hypothetical protein
MLGRGHRQVIDGVAFGASDKMMPVGEGVSHEEVRREFGL